MNTLLSFSLALLIAALSGAAQTYAAALTSGGGQPSSSAVANTAPTLAPRVTSVRMYLVAIGDKGRSGTTIGCGDSLVPVLRRVPVTKAPLVPALRLLLDDHHRYYGQSGLYNSLYQSHLKVQRATVRRGKAAIYLSGHLRLGGVCDDPRVSAQLRYTARQFRSVHRVAIFVNSRPLSIVLSEKGRY